MKIQEHVIMNLLKLVKFRSTSDSRHHKQLDIEEIKKELHSLSSLASYVEIYDNSIEIIETKLNGIVCYNRINPEKTKRTIFYIHGGGYIFERNNHTREESIAIACQANLCIPDYRLAPQHPHPAALEDVFNAYTGLLDSGVSPHDLFVMGDSAGGGLTLALLLKLRDEKKPLPKAAVVMSPWADLSFTGESFITRAESDPLLSPIVLQEVADFILNGASPLDPYISPVYGNYTGLPPLAIFVGGREVLYDDSKRVADIAQEHGVDVIFDEEEDMVHVYPLLEKLFPEATEALARMAHFINKHHKKDKGVYYEHQIIYIKKPLPLCKKNPIKRYP